MSSTPIDSLNSGYTSRSEKDFAGRIGSPIASEFLRSYRSSPSPSPGNAVIPTSYSEQGRDSLVELRERINGLEEQRLQLTSTHNEQVTGLEAEVARWRDESERGEATRQKLEYELAVVKKALNREKDLAREKDRQLKAATQKHEELSGRGDELTKTLRLREEEMLKVVDALKNEINEKDSKMKNLRDENCKLQKDKEQVERVFAEQENSYSEAQEKLSTLRMERDTQTDTVRRQLKDLQYATEREERFKREMEVALTKIKSLEETTEAERAAHLETKFNSELIQLRLRDMQGALEAETAARNELLLKNESMARQISDSEVLYKQETTTSLSLRNQLERTERELDALKTRLSSEVDGKHVLVTDMSEQLEIHQKSFSELKEELKKAKKRQGFLEETYGGCMRELELLVTSIQHQSTTKKNRGQQRDALSPPEVLEKLRNTMNDFQKRLNSSSKEVIKLKDSCEKMNRECEQYKEIMWKQDRSHKDLQKKYSTTSKELERVRQLYQEHQTQTTAFKVALQRAEQDRHSEKSKGQDLTDEFIRQLKALEDQLENRRGYLHSLHERIEAGAEIPGLTGVKLSESTDWVRLSAAVQERVTALMVAYNQEKTKVSQLTTAVHERDAQLHRQQESHEGSLHKLREAAEKREKEWSTQRSKMEKHYKRQLADLKTRAKKTEETAQSAWHSAQTATTVRGELEGACQNYQQQLNVVRDKLNSALIACSLLLGALWGHRAQVVDLVKQRDLLNTEVDKFHRLRSKLEEFAAIVSGTMDGEDTGMPESRPLLTFRRGVVAVLAANRLCHLASQKTVEKGNYQISEENSAMLPIYIWPTCLSQLYMERRMPYVSCGIHHYPRTVWVAEDQLLSAIDECVAGVRRDLNTRDMNESQLLPQSAHQCLYKLLTRVESTLPSQPTPGYSFLTARQSHQERGDALVGHLAKGLHRVLSGRTGREGAAEYSAQATLATLKKQFVSFTKRLHSSEVERRSLRAEISRSREKNRMMSRAEQKAESLQRELVDMKIRMESLVDKDKVEGIHEELNRALLREEEAQRVLNEQSDQIGQLSSRLNVQTTDDIEKERTIAQAARGLSAAALDLKRREQSIHELERRVVHLEEEKQTLRDRMREMENRVKEKTKDRDAMLLYLKSLEAVVEKARRNLLHQPNSYSYQAIFDQLLTSASLSDVNLKESEANTIRSLLQAFLDAQKTAVSRIGMLEEELLSHKQHVSSLKRELSAVCRRERDADQALRPCNDPTSVLSSFPSVSSKMIGQSLEYSYQAERSYGEEFAPLRETIDYSSQNTPSAK